MSPNNTIIGGVDTFSPTGLNCSLNVDLTTIDVGSGLNTVVIEPSKTALVMSLSDVPSIDIDDRVYYHELEDSQAGLCVERSDGAQS